MNVPSSYFPPGPREPDFAALPNAASYPPPPSFFAAVRDHARWDTKPPLSQSRHYVSPDPSPVNEAFDRNSFDTLPPQFPQHPQHPRGFPIPPVYHDRPTPVNPKFAAPNHTLEVTDADPWYNPVMVAAPKQTQTRRNSKNPKKVEGKQPTFLTKLYALLEQAEYHHIIRWDDAGESIIIEKPDELANKILPVVYRQSRFASFSRQLNIYGFNRKLSLRHVEPGVCDPDASTWSHPFLHRHSSKDEILGFKRRVPPRPSQAQKRRQSMQEEGLSPSSGSEHSFHSPPDPYQHHLLPDVDEEKPFVFHQQNPFMGQNSWNMSRGSFLVREETSPTSMDVDYDFPQDGLDIAQFDNSCVPRPLQLPDEVPSFRSSNPDFSRNSSTAIPQSAPANTTTFPIPIRVTQQHARTRSVQGEPSSAMLFSPTSPYNAASWLPGDMTLPANGNDQLPLSASSLTDVANPWKDRNVGNITSSNFSLLGHANPSRFASGQSLVSNGYEAASYLSRTPSFGQTITLAPQQSFAALSPDSPDASQTVLPGVYQSGLSFDYTPEDSKQGYSTSLPCSEKLIAKAATATRQERRATISSGPYSPRNKLQPLTMGGGSLRTIADRRGSDTPIMDLSLSSNTGTKFELADDDQHGLPSASVHLADDHPFEGLLSVNPTDMG